MQASSSIIELLATTALVPYSTVERMTRPMKDAHLWMQRGSPKIRPEYLSSILLAFSASQPSEALTAIYTCRSLNFVGFLDKSSTKTDNDNAVCPDDAIFDHDGADYPTLDEYTLAIVRDLAAMAKDKRHERVSRLKKAGWKLTICLAPAFALITWREKQGDIRIDRTASWMTSQTEMYLGQPKEHRGVQRLTSIPPDLFRVAADILASSLMAFVKRPSPLEAAPTDVSSEDENTGSLAGGPVSTRA